MCPCPETSAPSRTTRTSVKEFKWFRITADRRASPPSTRHVSEKRYRGTCALAAEATRPCLTQARGPGVGAHDETPVYALVTSSCGRLGSPRDPGTGQQCKLYGSRDVFRVFRRIIALFTCLAPCLYASGITEEEHRTVTQWAPYLEWSVSNPSYDGNPFDLIAKVIFVHSASGETRVTEMFYDGHDRWKFRFTGTRIGIWTFISQSSDPELNGLRGKITVVTNADRRIKGFLTTIGSQFAHPVADGNALVPFIFNVYQDNLDFPADYWDWERDRSLDYIRTYPAEQWAADYLHAARSHGSATLFIALGNQWLKAGALRSDSHKSENPDLRTFDMLERVISKAHSLGGHVHIWMWGDQTRKWTPVGLRGGINGEVDRRLQRYIAARLGPLPGWSLGYGFDLEEWVTEEEVGFWAEYLHQHFGWNHLVWARNRTHARLDAVSHNGRGPDDYADVLEKLQDDPDRPHIEEERFYYRRWDKWDMEHTRRHLWWNVMAGGMGTHLGRHPESSRSPYPDPDQLKTYLRFWSGRYRLEMEQANKLTDGYCIRTHTRPQFVFYKENTGSITLDLSGISGAQPAIAIDTKKPYLEIDLGLLQPDYQTWMAPHRSDWAIAVGEF